MGLIDIVRRTRVPEPWTEGENIPWSDPEFSERMLREHLSQEHDGASRRFETIDRHVAWIHHDLLGGRPTKILDLACGPGLYTSRLADLGHTCVGIDYSPASIRYARDTARRERHRCTYLQSDIRVVDFGKGFGLAMLLYGELNVFRPREAAEILSQAQRALLPGGLLVLEPHTYSAVHKIGERDAVWNSRKKGLFADEPYLYLEENFWDEDRRAATTRYYIVDVATARVIRYAQSFQAYPDEEYEALLAAHGFENVRFYPSLTGDPEAKRGDLMVIVARRGAV